MKRRMMLGRTGAAIGQYAKPDPTPQGVVPAHPFPNSIYTTPINNPVEHPSSSVLVANFVNQYTILYNDININSGPVRYLVNGNKIGKTQIIVNPGNRWSGPPSGETSIPIPPGFSPSIGGDDDAFIWDLDNNMAYETWVTGPKTSFGPWTSNTIGIEPTDGSWSGMLPWSGDTTGLSSSTSAAHMSFGGMLITKAEMEAGLIDHAIQMAIGFSGHMVAPATAFDSYVNTNSIPEGTRFYMPSNVAMPTGLPVIAQLIFGALKKYGMFIFDTTAGTSVTTAIESPAPWSNYDGRLSKPPYWPIDMNISYGYLNGIPWNSMVAVLPATAAAIVGGLTGPSAPVLSVTAGATGTASLSWTTSVAGTAGAISDYLIFQGTAAGQENYWPVTTATTTTTSITGLTTGTTYYFRVLAATSDGTYGVPSNEVSLVAP